MRETTLSGTLEGSWSRPTGGGRRDEKGARLRRGIDSILVLVAFLWFGGSLVGEISQAQVGLENAALAPEQKYLWFARLQTMKAVIGLVALVLGLISASSAWRAVQRRE